MKQYEAVVQVMRENGGYATLGYLYQYAVKVEGVAWNTKTPFKSINRIVQTNDLFFRIRPGLWALQEFRDKLPEQISNLTIQNDKSTIFQTFSHSYYQGLLLEVGNLENFQTYIPPQDKNKPFMNKTLGEIAGLREIIPFASVPIVNRAKMIDVIWFNQRQMPAKVFEVEHSTDIQNSLTKFVDLQDFNIQFVIVADTVRKRLFEKKLSFSAFETIKSRVQFLSYDHLSNLHTRTIEYVEAKKISGL